ncbi:MAG: helicase-related protein [Leptonema sp. (in: bacteria)]
MNELIYYVAEEEKIPIVLNKLLKAKSEQFVIFSKDKKQLMNFFNYFKKYKIPYTHLYSSQQFSIAFKKYNEKKSKVFLISDDLIEKKSFFINSTNHIIHYDIPTHPLIYQKRNDIIKNQDHIKSIHLLCNEKETQELKAIEVYYEKKLQKGIINESDIKFPKVIKATKQIPSKKSLKKHKKEEAKKPLEKRRNLIEKIKEWLWNLFRKSK